MNIVSWTDVMNISIRKLVLVLFVAVCGTYSVTAFAQGNKGIYQTATAFEHGDAGRSHTFGGAVFSGDMVTPEKNKVLTKEAPSLYPGAYNIVTREKDELYVYFGVYGDADDAKGPAIAKLDARTLEEIWRTEIADFSDTTWNYPGVLSLHGNGNLYVIGGNILATVDADTGALIKQATLPSKDGPNSSYNGFITTSDGTIFTKPIYRSCAERGGQALLKCPDATTPSILLAIDPDTLEIIANVPVPEPVFGRLIVGTHGEDDYVYMQGAKNLFRFRWDGEALAIDNQWGFVNVLSEGQTVAASPSVGDEWLFFQTNGAPSNVPMSVWAISTVDSNQRFSIQPFSGLSFKKSFNFSMGTFDPETNRVFVADAGAGYIGALQFNPDTGFTRLWYDEQTTFSYTMLVGLPDRRVFVATGVTGVGSNINPLLARREQVFFRNASTGDILAESERLNRMSLGANLVAGFDGRFYYLGQDSRILEISVK